MLTSTGRSSTGRPARLRSAANVVVSLALAGIGLATAPELLVGLTIAAAVGVSCEMLAPLHDGSRDRRRWLVDLTHAVGDRAVIVPLVALALAVAGPVVAAAVPGAVDEAIGALPRAAQLALIVVVTDFVNYLTHRALHRVPALWAFHAVHHSSERLDWLATSRVHPLDLAVNITAVTLPTYALGEAELAPWLLTLFFVYPFVTHANARLRFGAADVVLVTPAFHHWHHAADEQAHDRNFGMFLSVWDRVFATAVDSKDFPTSYGLPSSPLDGADYLGHLAIPFRTNP